MNVIEAQENLSDKAHNLADYWREQAEMWAKQEKAWHELRQFLLKEQLKRMSREIDATIDRMNKSFEPL